MKLPVNRISSENGDSSWLSILGGFSIFCSAFCFYLSSAIVRISTAHVNIMPAYFVFARFLLGFIVVLAVMKIGHFKLRPVRYSLLAGRTVANCMAVFFFYKAVTVISVSEANILNMTYPLFITIFSWVLFKHQRDLLTAGTVLIAFIGVWLVVSPGSVGLKLSSLWGLASGITASVAILYLNISRQHHDTNTILFFMFGGGTLMMLLTFYNQIYIPNLEELYYLVSCSSVGILGQYLLTIGFRYVTAVEGSIISFTRILLAAFIGPYLLDDPILTASGWIGALLIFVSNTVLAVRKINRRVRSE